MYGVLGALAARGWLRNRRVPHAAVVIVLAILVGVIDELHQRGVAGRSSELADLAADAAGVVVAFAVVAKRTNAFSPGKE